MISDLSALVSCLCVTRGRVAMLRRAVACFQAQSYAPRELVVVFDADDVATQAYVERLDDPRVRAVRLRSAERQPLGSLRNIAMSCSRGQYVAQWDDDDWHAPNRLARQLAVLRATGKGGCVLLRWTMYDAETGRAHVSGRRTWEGSLVAEKSAVPAYPPLKRAEDSHVVSRMTTEAKLVCLDDPRLYVYTFHGANTWDRQHWEWLLDQGAEPLSAEETSRIGALLQLPDE